MKRLLDSSIKISTKKARSNPTTDLQLPWHYLPEEVWGEITGHLNSTQGLKLISTSSFFYNDLHCSFKQRIFLEKIQKHIFDYSHQNELGNFIDLPVDQEGFTKLINLFVNKLQAVNPEIL